MPQAEERLGLGPLISFCLPTMALSILVAPATSVLPGIYAKYFGLSLTTVAFAVLIARLLDAITDPLIGYLSDRSIRRGGSRKAWVIFGAIASLAAGWCLYAPIAQPTFAYFLVSYVVFYVAMTSMDIPHNAWASELAHDYQDRTRLFGFKGILGTLGQLSFYAIPFLPILASREFTPEALRLGVMLAAIVMLPSLLWAAWVVPKGNIGHLRGKGRVFADLSSLWGNGPFLIFLAIFALAGLGFGVWGGLLFIVLDSYLKAEGVTAVVFVLAVPTGLLGIPFWYFVSKKTSKKFAWQAATTLLSISMAAMVMLKPGNGANTLIMALTAAIFFFGSCIGVLGPSIVGDAADFGTLKSGRDLNGTYFALFTAVTKANVGLGGALGLGLVGLYGYDASGETSTASANLALMISFSVLPAILIAMSAIVMRLFPIDARRHAIILKRIRTRPFSDSRVVAS